ncbi:anthrone oxygenase family protein [Tunturiibacter psychrotolerans]|uniref:anthrone oxygenase family protein n=1 Tax=Tunturiibacter psychrotolerans TaxID=3069686 RepID=UPI003D1C9AA9
MHPGLVFRCAGLFALLVFISITLGGTVPINQAALTWNAAEPPEGWQAMINRWERLDTARTWAAIAAFLFFLAAAALR